MASSWSHIIQSLQPLVVVCTLLHLHSFFMLWRIAWIKLPQACVSLSHKQIKRKVPFSHSHIVESEIIKKVGESIKKPIEPDPVLWHKVVMAQVYSQCPQPFPHYDCGCNNTSQCRNTVGDCSSCLGVKTCFLNIKVFERILVDTRHKSISLKKKSTMWDCFIWVCFKCGAIFRGVAETSVWRRGSSLISRPESIRNWNTTELL